MRASPSIVAGVVRRGAVDAKPNADTCVTHRPDRRDARREPHVRAWAVRDPGAGSRKQPDARRIELHAMRAPHVRPDPAEALCIFSRCAAELLARVGDVVVVLGQVRVQRDLVLAREQRRVAHQLAAHRERRARRDHDALHRKAPGVCASARSGAACLSGSRLRLRPRGRAAARPCSGRRSSSRAPHENACRSAARLRCCRRGSLFHDDRSDRCRGDRSTSCSPTAAARPSRSAWRHAPSPASGWPRSGTGPAASRTVRCLAPARGSASGTCGGGC